jgi:hypothetical protein
MGDWTNKIASELEQRRVDQEKREQIQLHRAEIIRVQGPEVFRLINEQAEKGVQKLRNILPECSDIYFEDRGDGVFRVGDCIIQLCW